ncbi:MAG: phage capsid protein [Pseudomonadota bacterium]
MLFAPEWFVNEYRATTRHIYQSQGFKLKSTVMPEGRIEGKTAYWPVMGTFEMQEKQRGSDTPPANPDQSQRSADLKDYDALYEIHQQDLNKMTANERTAAQQAGGNAVGRKSDAIIMATLNAFGGSTIGNGSGDWDLMQAITAVEQLQDDDQVPTDGGITCVLPWRWYDIMMLYKEFNNAEWVGGAGLEFPKGTAGKFWRNVNWLPMSKKELIIPGSNQAYGFIYHRTAIGYASNYEGQSTMAWDNRKGCWTVRLDLQAAGMNIYAAGAGIRRLHFLTNTALARPVERTQAVT